MWAITLRWWDMLVYIPIQASISLYLLHFAQVQILHLGLVRLWFTKTMSNVSTPGDRTLALHVRSLCGNRSATGAHSMYTINVHNSVEKAETLVPPDTFIAIWNMEDFDLCFMSPWAIMFGYFYFSSRGAHPIFKGQNAGEIWSFHWNACVLGHEFFCHFQSVAVCKGRGYNFTFWHHVAGDCLIVTWLVTSLPVLVTSLPVFVMSLPAHESQILYKPSEFVYWLRAVLTWHLKASRLALHRVLSQWNS